MELRKVAEIFEEMIEVDSIGIGYTMTDEQIEAIKTARRLAENPEAINCGGCICMIDEDATGQGWCSFYDTPTECDDDACPGYQMKEDV